MYKIKLGNNQIDNLDKIKELVDAAGKLIKIELQGNPCCTADYKEQLFKKCPRLECIDSESKTGETVESTLYDNEDSNELEEFEDDEDNEDGEEDFDDEENEEFEEDEEDEEEEESEKPQKKHKKN